MVEREGRLTTWIYTHDLFGLISRCFGTKEPYYNGLISYYFNSTDDYRVLLFYQPTTVFTAYIERIPIVTKGFRNVEIRPMSGSPTEDETCFERV